MNFAPCAKFLKPCKNPPIQTTSEDVFSEDEWLGFSFLGLKEARGGLKVGLPRWPILGMLFGLPRDPLVISYEPLKVIASCACPIGYETVRRLVKIETPHETELELCMNVMEATPEDQHSQHARREFQRIPIHEGPHASTSYECTVMYSATYRAASDPTTYCATSTYFPWDGKTNGLKRQISNFSAKENEKFYERYMEAINACPHHGFDTWLLNPRKAMDFLSYVAEVSRGWDEPNAKEVGRMKSQPNAPNAKAGMPFLKHQCKLCRSICQSFEHLVEECPTIPAVREMFGDQANVIGQFKPNNNASYGNTYNSNWRNHPNFSWKPRAPQYTQPGQAPPQASNLEQAIVNLSKVVGDFVGDQKSINAQLVKELTVLTNLNTVQEKGKFPSQPHQNPKGIHEVEAQEGESSQVREVKAVITLRSGKEVDLPTSKPEHEPESEAEKEKREEIKGKRKGIVQRRRTLNLLDDWRDVCGESFVGLGASVNLLPYSVYKQLGLGELKPTSITLSLADRSVKIPRGMIEDVLVQVDKFYYLVDFVVLDTDPVAKGTNYVPIILGRPFLATSNAIINCRNGVMQLTFGNMMRAQHLLFVQETIPSGRRRRTRRGGYLNPQICLLLCPLEEEGRNLPLFNGEEIQEAVKEEPPKLILKPLPTELKYAYLEENKQSPVVISSSLTTTQEDCLLEVLRRCKKAIGGKFMI
ncbi:hypothetical protein CK203_056241 [Vitis vinifera]|uniref:Retrotransposon gag domain-containing protein n=1 Tax=Vitis vinifera TaxID=29760 RepID=A0A438GJK8_VITVI|nr:hypothetical protein CK203_056241 [Vitis vinifera]